MNREERNKYEIDDWKRIFRSQTDPDEIAMSTREVKKNQRREQKRNDTGL